MKSKGYDVAIVGAGVFGSCAALEFVMRGFRTLLLDAYGSGHSRSSSGGETRIIRMGYGPDDLYTRLSMRALNLWNVFLERTGKQHLFRNTGSLWLGAAGDSRNRQTAEVLSRLRIPHELMTADDLKHRYPQMSFETIDSGLFEPEAGVILARTAVRAIVDEAMHHGL